MLIQIRDEGLRLIRQHDHGLLSGELAAAWDGSLGSGAWDRVVVLATALHDLGWRELDAEPRWNPETRRPYDFLDFPSDAKFGAAADGIDRVEELHPYAAVLVSLHYSTFGSPGRPTGFEEEEEDRRMELLASLEDEAPGPRDIQADLSALRLFDNLSLFLCLTPPGAREGSAPSWLTAELLRWPSWVGNPPEGKGGPGKGSPVGHRTGKDGEEGRIRLSWADAETAILDPWLFEGDTLSLEIPYRDLPRDRFPDSGALDAAWRASTEKVWKLRIAGP